LALLRLDRADRLDADDDAGRRGLLEQDQNVERIAVAADRRGDEPKL
jgi:hypothetical protein